jgi:hypothetical protein
MKRNIRIIIMAVLLVTSPMILMAQQPPHPNNGNAPTPGTNGPVGGGAPIDSGLLILLALSFGYGVKNHFNKR